MPCRYDGPMDPTISRERLEEYRMVEAVLCAISTVIEGDAALRAILDRVDWKAAGVNRYQFEEWWASHKAADDLRRMQEAEEEARKRKIKAAKRKLSKEERELLGIK